MTNASTSSYLLAALLLSSLPLGASTVHAEGFWAHRIGERIDVAYGDDPLQKMDVYVHGQRVGEPRYFDVDPSPRPTLVWIHGGGWVAGDKSTQTTQLIPYLQRGWNVYNINYRQGPDTEPQAVDDVMCAYKFITEELNKFGQPTDQVVVSGASAGGHLSLVVGLLNTTGEHPCRSNHPPRAVVNWFGITDIEMVDEYLDEAMPQQNYARTWAGNVADVAKVSDAYSPMYLISDQAPPIITVHGTDDTVVPYEQGESFHSSLNTPNELVTLEGGNHSGFTEAQYQEALQRIFAFLEDH